MRQGGGRRRACCRRETEKPALTKGTLERPADVYLPACVRRAEGRGASAIGHERMVGFVDASLAVHTRAWRLLSWVIGGSRIG